MKAAEKLEQNGYDPEEIILLVNESYDSALIGVSSDDRAVYDYDKMVAYLKRKYRWSDIDAIEWIDYNTLPALQYAGDGALIIINKLR